MFKLDLKKINLNINIYFLFKTMEKKVHDFRLKFKFNSKKLKTSEDNLREVRKKEDIYIDLI